VINAGSRAKTRLRHSGRGQAAMIGRHAARPGRAPGRSPRLPAATARARGVFAVVDEKRRQKPGRSR